MENRLHVINYYLAPIILYRIINYMQIRRARSPKIFRSSQHCKGGAGGAWDVENRQLRSISGASMRDPNFWKGTFFPDIGGN